MSLAGLRDQERQSLFARFRVSEPWHYKAPFLISVVYFFLYVGSVRFTDAILCVACALCTIAGIAGIGYLSNDLADRDEDRRAGRANATQDVPPGKLIALMVWFGACALFPWILFAPVNRVCIALLALEFLLFIAYAVPPVRLKKRGLLGPITDALYAHANPALLCGYTMYLATGKSYPQARLFLGFLCVWQFFLGLRNILQHQITDAVNDRAAGTATWVIRRGEAVAARLLSRFVVPMELAWFTFWCLVASLTIPALFIAFVVHSLAIAFVIRRYAGRIAGQPQREVLAVFMDDFVVGWMPLVTLSALCVANWRMVTILLLHVVVFQSRVKPLLSSVWRTVREIGAR
jgi:hypothetical protein